MLKRFKKSAQAFLIISLLMHIMFWGGLEVVHQLKQLSFAVGPSKSVEIELVEVPTNQNNQQQKLKPKMQQQIVEQDERQLNEEIPEDSRFLSRHNQRVKRQTRAAETGRFQNKPIAGEKVAGQPDAPKKRSQKAKPKDSGSLPSLEALSPKFSMTPQATSSSDGKAGRPSQSDDYMKDVKIGMETLLSTREFVYYSYYSRIKEKIRQYWEPNVRHKVNILFRKGRTIASAKDRVTQLIVTLDSKGSLMGVQVITESGVKDLDAAAVEAFRSAAPFPNPPAGMVEPDGTIKIRWDFILEASSIDKNRKQMYAEL